LVVDFVISLIQKKYKDIISRGLSYSLCAQVPLLYMYVFKYPLVVANGNLYNSSTLVHQAQDYFANLAINLVRKSRHVEFGECLP